MIEHAPAAARRHKLHLERGAHLAEGGARNRRLRSWQASALEQERDDEEKRKMGTGAHGNLFLSVARAKKSNLGDVRAVCPFSSATEPKIPADAQEAARFG